MSQASPGYLQPAQAEVKRGRLRVRASFRTASSHDRELQVVQRYLRCPPPTALLGRAPDDVLSQRRILRREFRSARQPTFARRSVFWMYAHDSRFVSITLQGAGF